ncbi:MAG: tetratricopeptide repeat protein [Bacteroidetes bacterium]|nr:tetratricopeptide repeat protein [Bacteroidota bacterium]
MKRSYDSLYSRFITCRIDTQKVLFYFRLSEAIKDTVLIRQTITKGLTLAKRINYVHGITMGLNTLGQYYRQQGIKDYPKSIALYDSALVIATRVRNKADMATAYHNLGQIFRFKGDYARALDYYNKANVVAHEASDSTQIMWNYHDIGWMRISMKNYPEAIAYLEQGLAFANAIQHAYATADITMHIGEAYWFMGKFDSSLFLSNKAYDLFEPQKSDENMIHCLNQLGGL